MKQLKVVYCLLGTLALLAISCSSPTASADGGGGTDYPNTFAVRGVIADSMGNPAPNTRVLLIDMSRDPSDSRQGYPADTAHTDNNGAFRFENVYPGSYSIEGANPGDNQIVYRTGLRKEKDSALIVDTLNLESAGSLSGTVRVRSNIIVVVELVGTHYRAMPDSMGAFVFSFVPQDSFSISISIYDTESVRVIHETVIVNASVSDSTSIADILQLPEFYSWPYVRKLALNTTRTGAGITEDVHGFPLLVRLDSATFDFSSTPVQGRDLHFARHEGQEFQYEIEEWDSSNARAAVWVALDTIFADSLQPLYMFWGDQTRVTTSAAGGVFDTSNGFRAVWHLAESAAGTGTDGLYRDATLWGAHGSDQVSATGKSGIIGLGPEFDGTDDYVPLAQSIELDGPITISCWFKADVVPTSGISGFRLVSNYNDNLEFPYGFQLRTSNNDLVFVAGDGSARENAEAWDVLTVAWQYIVAVYEPGTGRVEMYVDGNPVKMDNPRTKSQITYAGTVCAISNPSSAFTVDGSLDEVRICNVKRSFSWIRLCYENQKERQTLVETN